MAHWISSKLKVAENLLQQIDQQAAESLGKNESPPSDERGFETTRKTAGSKPLKDQLKKKGLENEDLIGKSQSERSLNLISPNSSSSSTNSSISSFSRNSSYRDKEVVVPVNVSPKLIGGINDYNGNDSNRDKEVPLSVNLGRKATGSNNLTDADWTDLLSVPNKKGATGVVRSSNRVSGVRGVRKDGRRQGSSGSESNLSASEGKRSQKAPNGDLRSSRKLDSKLGSQVNRASLDGGTSNLREVTPRSVGVDFRSDGEGRGRGDLDGEEMSEKLNIRCKDEDNKGKNELNGSRDGELVLAKDDHKGQARPSMVASAIVDGNLDFKRGMKSGERFESAVKGFDKSAPLPWSSTSTKRAPTPRSDVESDSETDSTSSSNSESELEREERRKKRQQMLAEKAAAKALEAIKERENSVARLEGEKQSLEKILEERSKQQVQEASELQSTMMEAMEAVELEKQKHNNTRMEAFARLAKLETTNADLARSLATAQWNLELEVDRVAKLRQQIQLKEATHEDLRRKISSSRQSGIKLNSSKGIELEREILEAENSFLTDKVGRLQDKAKTLETSIESTRRELENPTEVEIELKRRLDRLTDHLIQKQAQVEALSSEKATVVFKIEAISRSLDESKDSADFPTTSSRDLESGLFEHSNLRPLLEERIRSGRQHLGSFFRQLDSIFCAGAIFLRRNSAARIWSLVYLVCLHLWVIYILSSHSSVSDEARSGAVVSLQNINNTGGA